MEFMVLLDTNVVLARCLDPSMDAKARLAEEVFRILSDVKLAPCITDSVRQEFETKLHARVGQVLDAVRKLSHEPAPVPSAPPKSSIELMEDIFARLRSEAPNASGALQLLETRLARSVEGGPIITADFWSELLGRVVIETTGLLAEIQRRADMCGLEVVRRPSSVDHERFRLIVPKPDLEHIASAAGLCETRKCRVIFVTLESPLHAVREEISKAAPDLVVTTPTYLEGQIRRLRAST